MRLVVEILRYLLSLKMHLFNADILTTTNSFNEPISRTITLLSTALSTHLSATRANASAVRHGLTYAMVIMKKAGLFNRT